MSRRLGMTLIGLVVLLTLGVAGLAGYLFVIKPAAQPAGAAEVQKAADEKEKQEPDPAFFKMKNFVTDLADKERLRYVDVAVAIAVQNEAAVESVKRVEPQIRDVILSQLRSRFAADLAGAAGKDKLAQDLTDGLAPILKKQLKKVYIVDLVIQ